MAEEKRKRGRPKKDLDPINKRQSNGRGALGKFVKGNRSSPGRPAGSRNKSTLIFEQIGLNNAMAVYQKMVDLALAGDVTACRAILDRVYPPRKGRGMALNFEGSIKTIQDMNRLSEHITTMLIAGYISAEEAEDYGKWIDRRIKTIIDSDVMDKMNSTLERVKNVSK